MRITFVVPPLDLSGGQRVVAIHARNLAARGHHVEVVAPAPPRTGFRERLRQALRPATRHDHPPGKSHVEEAGVRHRILERYRPVSSADLPDADVVVATWWETAEWVAALPERKGRKAYFLQHYEVFPYTPADRVTATWRLPFHKITVSRWLADIARDVYGDGTASLVPNAVDLRQFDGPSRGKQPSPTFGLMYSTAPFKGCDLSLRAFRLAAERRRLALVAFGATATAPDLPLPEGSEYHILPPQSSMRLLYGRCDAWLFGSRSEGFGLPILEAMACRTPVIGFAAGAAPELIGRGGGILVGPEDPEGMAEAILRICELDDARWRAMSEAARRTAVAYTWDDATDLFEAALKHAVDTVP